MHWLVPWGSKFNQSIYWPGTVFTTLSVLLKLRIGLISLCYITQGCKACQCQHSSLWGPFVSYEENEVLWSRYEEVFGRNERAKLLLNLIPCWNTFFHLHSTCEQNTKNQMILQLINTWGCIQNTSFLHNIRMGQISYVVC